MDSFLGLDRELNMFNGTKLTLISDIDQDTYGKVTEIQENKAHKRAKRSAISQQMTTAQQ